MNWVLGILYLVTTAAFLPLFVVIMVKIKKDFTKLYNQVSCKLIMLFTILFLFLILRLLIYIDINFTHLFFTRDGKVNLNSEIPFFISEIIITFALSYILFAVSRETKNGEMGGSS
jgi:hypothetical protein